MDTSFALKKDRKEDEPMSISYSQMSSSRYPGGRDDGLSDTWPSTVDLTTNGWAPRPLSGPSTNRAEAVEARALKMIAVPAAPPSLRNVRHGAEVLTQNVHKKLSVLMSSISRTASQRRRRAITYSRNIDGVEAHSDSPLVVITIKSKDSSSSVTPAAEDTGHQQEGHLSSPGRQQEPANTEVTSDVVAPNPEIAQLSFEDGVNVSASSQVAVNLESPKSAASSHCSKETDNILDDNSSGFSDHIQVPWGADSTDLIPEDDMSVLELPPSLHRMYEQSKFKHWSLNPGHLALETDSKASTPRLAETSVLRRGATVSLEDLLSLNLTNNLRYVGEEDGMLESSSPPAWLMAEETDPWMENAQDLGNIQNSQYLSSENSAVLSFSDFTGSEYSLPAIYPGMEHHPAPSSCASEVDENWSNNSRSLFDVGPQHDQRMAPAPMRLRGGGGKEVPRRFNTWRLFLGDMPVGDAEKGKKLLDSPVSTMDNYLLGRRGKPRTGRELCEETEKRIEKGREMQRRKEGGEWPRKEVKGDLEAEGKDEGEGKECTCQQSTK